MPIGGDAAGGVGAGWASDEHAAVGARTDLRIGRFEEAFGALLQLFDTGHAAVSGQHLDFEGWLLPHPMVRRRRELIVGSLAPRLLRAALPEVDGWNWDGFHNDVQDFKADWAKVRAVAEDVGRDPETISRSAHLVVRTDGAEGLPIDPISFPIIQGGVDEHIGSASALALLPPSIGPDDRGRGIGQALMHTVLLARPNSAATKKPRFTLEIGAPG